MNLQANLKSPINQTSTLSRKLEWPMEASTGTGKLHTERFEQSFFCEVTVITSTPLALSLKCAKMNKDQDNWQQLFEYKQILQIGNWTLVQKKPLCWRKETLH